MNHVIHTYFIINAYKIGKEEVKNESSSYSGSDYFRFYYEIQRVIIYAQRT